VVLALAVTRLIATSKFMPAPSELRDTMNLVVEKLSSLGGPRRGTKSGRPIGRPAVPDQKRLAIRSAYKAGGVGMRTVGERFGVSAETVRRCLA
jgi:hypothetical protein